MMFQKDMEKNKIKKEMTFIEALEKYPYLSKIFAKYNFHCIFCPMAGQETIEEGAKVHGISVEKLVKELNREVEKYGKKNLS